MTAHPEAVPRFPLAWPVGWKRTPSQNRRTGQFAETVDLGRDEQGNVRKRSKSVSMATAVERLEGQLDRLGAADATLSTNVRLTLRGIPAGNEKPNDPGAAVYFRFKGRATVLACDSYQTVADNVAALAAHIDALRRIERYGVGTLEQALAGYKALPADTAADWRRVLGFASESTVSAEQVQTAYRDLAKRVHPDKPGGSDEAFSHLGRAKEFALAEILS